jgi:general secretion pathway protein B
MSYILDALRRSERDRRQAQSPGMGDIPRHSTSTAPPSRAGLFAAIALMVIGAVAIGAYFAFGTPHESAPPATETVAAAPASAVDAPKSAPTIAPPAIARSGTIGPPPEVLPPTEMKSSAPELKPSPFIPTRPDTGVRDLAREARVNPPRPKPSSTPADSNRVASLPPAASAPRSTPSDGLKFLGSMPPDFQSALPELVVNIHVYTPSKSDRILYINNRQYRAGDKIRDDIVIEDIVQDGAILSFRGQRFKLPRPG